MENQLLVKASGQQSWTNTNTNTPTVQAIDVSNGVWVSQSQDTCLQTTTYMALIRMADYLLDCLFSLHMRSSFFRFTSRWIYVLLYSPLDFITALVENCMWTLFGLPPFITKIVFPLMVCYGLYHAIQRALYEYQSFLDLGRGGTPSTPTGLVKVSVKKFFARVNVLEPPHVDPMLEPYRGCLYDLKRRVGERPRVKGVAPQRQFDQKTPITTFDRLLQMLKDIAGRGDGFKVTTSYLEGHNDALKATLPHRVRKVWGTDGEWDYEIAHPHRNDGSLHMVLHPEDVGVVIERGWGERHPLATDAWWWKVFYHHIRGKRRPVPYNLVLIYAPRDDTEYDIVRQLLEAAIWFNKEKDICDRINQGELARADCGKILTREEALRDGQWVVGQDGKLMTLERALDRGLCPNSTHGAGAMPVLISNIVEHASVKQRG